MALVDSDEIQTRDTAYPRMTSLIKFPRKEKKEHHVMTMLEICLSESKLDKVSYPTSLS